MASPVDLSCIGDIVDYVKLKFDCASLYITHEFEDNNLTICFSKLKHKSSCKKPESPTRVSPTAPVTSGNSVNLPAGDKDNKTKKRKSPSRYRRDKLKFEEYKKRRAAREVPPRFQKQRCHTPPSVVIQEPQHTAAPENNSSPENTEPVLIVLSKPAENTPFSDSGEASSGNQIFTKRSHLENLDSLFSCTEIGSSEREVSPDQAAAPTCSASIQPDPQTKPQCSKPPEPITSNDPIGWGLCSKCEVATFCSRECLACRLRMSGEELA